MKVVPVMILLLQFGCVSARYDAKIEQLEMQQARQYYLLRCDICDVYSNPGTPMNEQCIIRETKSWINIKKKRGWK